MRHVKMSQPMRHTLAISALLRVAQKPSDLALTIPELG